MPRYTLQLSDTHEKILERLMKLCNLKKGELLTDGLMLLSWAAVQASNGMSIAAIDEKRRVYKEVQTPALIAARDRGMHGERVSA